MFTAVLDGLVVGTIIQLISHKPLARLVILRQAQGGAALETLSWTQGQCVGYREEFRSGDAEQGAYVCYLTIAAPQLTLQAGAPAAYVAPRPGEHGSLEQVLVNPPPLLGPRWRKLLWRSC